MGEKNKDIIAGIIESEDVRKYFEKMLKKQTREIEEIISNADRERHTEELKTIKEELLKEEEKNAVLSLIIKDAEKRIEQCRVQLEEKKKELDLAREHVRTLNLQLAEQNEKNALLEGRNKELEQSLEDKIDTGKKQITEIQTQLSKYQERYGDIDHAFALYQSLSQEIKQRLSNLIGNEEVCCFIASVSNWTNIEEIWKFFKRRIIEDEVQDLNLLKELFESVFHLFCLVDGKGRYQLISPEVGEKYDSDRHSIKGIKTDGRVEKVLLAGIFDQISQKIIFKALISVK